MAAYFSCSCPFQAHALFSPPFHRLALFEHHSSLPTRQFARFPPPSPLPIPKFSADLACVYAGLRSCGSVGPKDNFLTSIAPSQIRTFSLSTACRPEIFGVGHRLDCRFNSNCRGDAHLSSSSPKRQMSVSGDIPDPRHRISAASGDNASIGTSYGRNTEVVDTPNHSDQDVSKAAAIPGIICPSVKTVGKSTNIVWQECLVKREEKEKLLGQKGCVIWITGLSGSGKSTLACALDRALLNNGKLSYVLDGDNVRHGLNKNLGFSAEDRTENIRRIGEVAKVFVDAGVICIASAISPYKKDRDSCRKLLNAGEFIEVYMNFPLNICEERDPKGLYKLARAGKIKGFTGIDDPYEAPLNCEVMMEPIDGKCPSPADMAARLVSYLEDRGFLSSPL